MKHNFSLVGFSYRLRPVEISDAQFIIDIRTQDEQRNKYIHPISNDLSTQIKWIKEYFTRPGDFYFVIENCLTGDNEGLISFYNVHDNEAEWGRWIIRKNSFAAAESVYLMYKIAFEQAGLSKLYCRTIVNNEAVVSFHTSIGEKTECILPNVFEINGMSYDAIKQFADKDIFYSDVAPKLEAQAQRIYKRNIRILYGGLLFDHIGIATHGIARELPVYATLGYKRCGDFFEDYEQGIRGLFIEKEGSPKIELLENLPGSTTLDVPLSKGIKMYHIGYCVDNFDKTIEFMKNKRARIVSQPKISIYFGKRIAFLLLPNMQMIEIIEK